MSNKTSRQPDQKTPETADVFAALGDPTRLALVQLLCEGSPFSISQLSAASPLSRQGITKHLRVLEDAGLVCSEKVGRESLFRLDPQPLHDAKRYIDVVSRQWDQALGRLKSFLED